MNLRPLFLPKKQGPLSKFLLSRTREESNSCQDWAQSLPSHSRQHKRCNLFASPTFKQLNHPASSRAYTPATHTTTYKWAGIIWYLQCTLNGNPLQYSCLENSMDRGAWRAAVHGFAQSQTQLKLLFMHACTGKGNGNPLQYSCLENPRDRRVSPMGSQSWTWLKQLSGSSSSIRRQGSTETFWNDCQPWH